MRKEGQVTSSDGTPIAFERSGTGPALVLVEPAGHHRGFSAFGGLAGLLAEDFTVVAFDRRGRGASGDTPPYAPEREVEDLAALVDAVGGSAFLYGFSSGALLSLHAVAGGLAVPRLALLEPPIADEAERAAQSRFTEELSALVDAGRRSEAVERFHTDIGVPPEVVVEMRGTPAWGELEAVAHTLVYDCLLSEATSPAVLAAVSARALVLDSEGSTDDLTGWAAGVARQLPRAEHRSLPGEWHGVAGEVLAPVLREFFLAAD